VVDDRYLPGPETPAGQEIRFAAGLADFVNHRRRIRAFALPAFTILGFGVAVLLITLLVRAH
jgi:hypothetical protein